VTIVDIIFAGWVGHVWLQCAVDVAYSSVHCRSTCSVSAHVATSHDTRPATAALVCYASSVDSVCHLCSAVPQPSHGTVYLCHGDTDLSQLGATGSTLWAWTLLQEVRVCCLCFEWIIYKL